MIQSFKGLLQSLHYKVFEAAYGAQLAHYPVVGKCLINSLKKFNNEEWSEDIEIVGSETHNSPVPFLNKYPNYN